MTTPPEPRYATARDPARRTLGPRIAATSRQFGKPLMPHQRRIVDTALELADPAKGRLRYSLVVVTIPRQSGKTTLCEALLYGRMLTEPDYRAWYTAQTGTAARDKFRREFVPDLQSSPMGRALMRDGQIELRRAAGQEEIHLRATRSRVGIFSPQPDALHGQTIDLVVIDEAWSFTAGRGEELLQACAPAMATRPRRQLWIISTAGDATSEFLRGLVDRGRTATTDPDATMAYFEWSADVPDHLPDPDAVAAVTAAHPAAGLTIDEQYIADQLHTLGRSEWLRAYANAWTTVAADRVITAADWTAARDPARSPTPGPAVVAVDTSPDRSTSAVAVAWRDSGGLLRAAVAAHGPGVDWLPAEAARLARRLRAPIVLDEMSPASTAADPLRRAGARIRTIGTRDVARACGEMYDEAASRTLRLVPDDALDAAAAAAVSRPIGDAWAWGRRKSAGDITPLVAVTFALWGMRHEEPLPVIV